MTKVQLRCDLQRPVDADMAVNIAKMNGVYGIEHIKIAPTVDKITVEYDATRLSPVEVETLLWKFGIPVVLNV